MVKMEKTAETRRSVIKKALGVSAIAGAPVVHAHAAPAWWTPIIGVNSASVMAGKEELTLLGDRPLNMETPPHLLDDDVTPAHRFFVRNNGLPPDINEVADEDWSLTIDGEVENPLSLTIADLKRDFEPVTLRLPLECGGNGRKFFRPAASGNQWTFGAVGFGDWTGVRLRDVLAKAVLKDSAYHTGHYGADKHLSGNKKKFPISRGVPIKKAIDPHTLIVWGLNGEPLPPQNGYPLRLIAPGWPGSCSQKWLTRIWVRDKMHDGAKMTGSSYRMPETPTAPGVPIPEDRLQIIESMPVKSLITSVKTGAQKPAERPFEVRGHAWSGETPVAGLDVSIDFGATWVPAQLDSLKNTYAPQRWRAEIILPQKGYYEIWARARDAEGRMQPATTPGWNQKGYLNNMQHRVAVFAV